MNDLSESSVESETTQCSWCEDGRELTGYSGDPVCGRCRTLLTNAGVSHVEIYGLEPEKET